MGCPSPAWPIRTSGIPPIRCRSARIATGQIDRFGAEDPTDGGNTNRFSLSARMAQDRRRRIVEGQRLRHQERTRSLQQLHLFPRDPDPRRPVPSARRPSRHRRAMCRGHSADRWAAVPTETTFGVQTRYDDIERRPDQYLPAVLPVECPQRQGQRGQRRHLHRRTRRDGPTGCARTLGWRGDYYAATVEFDLRPEQLGQRQRRHRQPEIHAWCWGRSTRPSCSSAPARACTATMRAARPSPRRRSTGSPIRWRRRRRLGARRCW